MESKDGTFHDQEKKTGTGPVSGQYCFKYKKNKSTSLDKANSSLISLLFLFKSKAWTGKKVTSKDKWVLLHVVYGCERQDAWVKER